MPKAVLFDLDGTLFDHKGAALQALRQWLPTVGLQASPSVLGRWFDAEELCADRWRAGLVSWEEQRRLRLRLVVPELEQADDTDLDHAFEGYLQRYQAGWRAYGDVAPALTAVADAGLRVGVLTNGAAVQQRAKLEALGLANRFEFVLTSEDLGTGKPDPVAYLTACDRFGLSAGSGVHVGDVPDLDVLRSSCSRAARGLDRSGRPLSPARFASLTAGTPGLDRGDFDCEPHHGIGRLRPHERGSGTALQALPRARSTGVGWCRGSPPGAAIR